MRFSVTLPPGRRGAQPPASLRGTMESGPTGQMRSGNPPPGCRGVPPGSASLGLRSGTSRKSAVWAEGLADGAPWAKPRHHQAASCGLRRCRELRVRRNPLGVEHIPELGDRQEACGGTVPVAADHRREATIRKLLSAPFALTRPTCGHTCPQAPPARRAYPVR